MCAHVSLWLVYSQSVECGDYSLSSMQLFVSFWQSIVVLLICVVGIALGESGVRWRRPILGQKGLVLRMCFRCVPLLFKYAVLLEHVATFVCAICILFPSCRFVMSFS